MERQAQPYFPMRFCASTVFPVCEAPPISMTIFPSAEKKQPPAEETASFLFGNAPPGTGQSRDDRRDDDARHDRFRHAVRDGDADEKIRHAFRGDAFLRRVGRAHEEVERPQEKHRVTYGSDHRGDSGANESPSFQPAEDDVGDDADEDARHDTDNGIISDIVLYRELEQQARRAQGLHERKEPEHETHERSHAGPRGDASDDGRDVQDRRVHEKKRDEAIPGQPEEYGDARQKS